MDKVPHWQATTISQESDSASYTHDMDTVMKLLGKHPTIWVFGYGSLLWKPDFRYKSKRIGYIEGYERRFYQGNITFRGKPGQVRTYKWKYVSIFTLPVSFVSESFFRL